MLQHHFDVMLMLHILTYLTWFMIKSFHLFVDKSKTTMKNERRAMCVSLCGKIPINRFNHLLYYYHMFSLNIIFHYVLSFIKYIELWSQWTEVKKSRWWKSFYGLTYVWKWYLFSVKCKRWMCGWKILCLLFFPNFSVFI